MSDEAALLDAILDTLIPPSADGRMPGAGALGLAETVRSQTAAAEAVVSAGLRAAEIRGFLALDAGGRVDALREIEREEPAFVATLYMPTCIAYYQHPQTQKGLGLEGRPPHPKGYDLESGNLDALARVEQRGPLYRPV